MKEDNTKREYDPTLDKPLTEEDIDCLWDNETTEHILNMCSICSKATGGHTTNAIEAYYLRKDKDLIDNQERPITIDYVAETEYPGYYIYYIRSAQTINKKVKTNSKGKVYFLPEISAKHAIDTNIVPIDEYFETIRGALIGATPQKIYDRYKVSGCSKNGIPFTAQMECKNSKWHFLTIYPTLKEKEKNIEKGM
jgi:hypothetical protein